MDIRLDDIGRRFPAEWDGGQAARAMLELIKERWL